MNSLTFLLSNECEQKIIIISKIILIILKLIKFTLSRRFHQKNPHLFFIVCFLSCKTRKHQESYLFPCFSICFDPIVHRFFLFPWYRQFCQNMLQIWN